MDFGNTQKVGAVNLWALELGDVINVTDYQTGVTTKRHMIQGVEFSLSPGGVSTLKYHVKRLDDVTYGIYDDTTYGLYDSTMRYAL